MVKLIGFIAVLAIIGLSMTACGGDDTTKFEGTWRNPGGNNPTFTFIGNTYTHSNNAGAINSGTFTYTQTRISFTTTTGDTWSQMYELTGNTLRLEQIPGRNFGPFVKQ